MHLDTNTGEVRTTAPFPGADFRPSDELGAPNAFTTNQLTNIARRYLLEQWGLAHGIAVVVPFHLAISLGQSIRYTDYDGTTRPYIVFNIEFNIEGTNATKTLVLLRQPDALL